MSKNICKFPESVFSEKTLSIKCFVRECDPSVMGREVKLGSNRMLLCTDGEGTACIDGVKYDVKSGILLFCRAGETVSVACGADLVYFYVDFDGTRAEELLRRFNVTELTRIYFGFEGLIPIWQESLFKSMEQNIDLAAESILLFTFSRIFDEKSSEGGIVGQIVRITEDEFSDHKLSASSIAEKLSYNPKYISHLFKKKTGVTYSEYLRSVRLKYAAMLFDRGIDSVKNVAQLSGFSDSFYFSNVFKRCMGMSPKEYIAESKSKGNR